ncbi:ATP-binding cassette domain-containing protein [Microlunatus parietis]|uniref:ABC-2 type transport system ATP-binding protein n=1 Tax=Microlunatus parietis TaxID=682979 RepID=A0A7Y9IA79_9ACTN|nr:ATP-binding cassette domain-containing protein [Microlunatus parietis]NYE72846.1 ABC-2 type transport system ATP-binding protein [Microlunatus parietis]
MSRFAADAPPPAARDRSEPGLGTERRIDPSSWLAPETRGKPDPRTRPERRDRPEPAARPEPRPQPRSRPEPESRGRGRRSGARSGALQVDAKLMSAVDVEPILIDGLSKQFDDRWAVRDLSFTARPGRVTGLLGPTGAGKTTTLRMLVGLTRPASGTATFGDYAYASLRHPQRRVGTVLGRNFHPRHSGRDHLRVAAATAGVSDEQVDDLLYLVGLADAAARPAETYSLGMQQRLAIAGALLGEPDYLILDEPAIGLDPEGIRWLRGFLRSFAATGRVVLISSHLLKDAQQIVDDVVVIRDGRLLDTIDMAELAAGGGTTRVRVDDLSAARTALADLAETIVCGDEEGRFLRVRSQDVNEIGFRLYRSDVIVYELVREELDLEQLFFSALEGAA